MSAADCQSWSRRGDVCGIVFCLVGASRLERRGTRFADFWNGSMPKLLVRALGTLQFGAKTDAQWVGALGGRSRARFCVE